MTAVAEFPFQVHPNRSDQTEALSRQIATLDDYGRRSLLHWLSGYDPAAVQRAIDWFTEKGLEL